ncbi:MAG: hypothetical protein JNK04_25595 [Myxococcales bacterium]|nr:hypothetical protein [Myxococcales bacterium]
MLRRTVFAALIAVAVSAGCTGANSPNSGRPEKAQQWFARAEKDFGEARVDDAHDAIVKALALAPADREIKTLGGRIALARLEFDESLRLLDDVPGSEAQGLRGRAYWYLGNLTPAADEFEAMLDDPEVKDDWAKAVAGLARQGAGRKPFTMTGDPRAAVDMAHVSDVAPYLVVQVEIDGEESLALLATGMAEVVVDSSTRAEPSWVSLKFKGRPITPQSKPDVIEVTDVPALTQDLTGVSKEVNAPIKALIGANLLRHLNPTLDYSGHQFIVRQDSPQPPPSATRLGLFYARGGGMVVGSGLGADAEGRGTLFVDSSMRFPLALDERGWIKAGVTPSDLTAVPGDPSNKLKEGIVPLLKLGAFDLQRIPGVLGAPVADIEKGLRFDVDGIMGAPLLAHYRITFADGGRALYLEDDSELRRIIQQGGGFAPSAPQGGPPAAGPPGAGPQPLDPGVAPRPLGPTNEAERGAKP